MQTNTERERKRERWYAKKHNTSKLENEAMYTNILVPRRQGRLNDKSVYIIISFLLHYSSCQNHHPITNITLPNLKTRLCIQIILVPRGQRRLNDESVYIIISFLLHYSGCQNRHANYKYRHNISKLENEAMYTNYTCTTETKTT